jgi:hypothetical protein
MAFDKRGYYVEFSAFKRADSKVVKVPKALFDRLARHRESLELGNYVPNDDEDGLAAYDEAYALPDEDLRKLELESIADEQFIYVAVC